MVAVGAFAGDFGWPLPGERRKISPSQRALFLGERARTRGQVQASQDGLTDEDRRKRALIEKAAELLAAARAGGLRTPHKASRRTRRTE